MYELRGPVLQLKSVTETLKHVGWLAKENSSNYAYDAS
jgi:hypothetical protein